LGIEGRLHHRKWCRPIGKLQHTRDGLTEPIGTTLYQGKQSVVVFERLEDSPKLTKLAGIQQLGTTE
jgi:hypothetical protein